MGDTDWLEGGTGVANFLPEYRPLYEEAVKRYSDPKVFLRPNRFGPGARLPGGSLHCTNMAARNNDLGDFWRIFDKVKEDLWQKP